MLLNDVSETSDFWIFALTGVFFLLNPSFIVFNLGCTQRDGMLAFLDIPLMGQLSPDVDDLPAFLQ